MAPCPLWYTTAQKRGCKKHGAVDETRTRDLRLGKATLYQLSYYRKRIVWCGRRDSNSYASRHQILNLARLPFRHARTKLKKMVTHPRLERGTL